MITGGPNPVTQDLINVLKFTTGVEKNDVPLVFKFPYMAPPRIATGECGGALTFSSSALFPDKDANLKLGAPEILMSQNSPNPAKTQTTFKYRMVDPATISIKIYDQNGSVIDTPVNSKTMPIGTHEFTYNVSKLESGIYYAIMQNNGQTVQSIRFSVIK